MNMRTLALRSIRANPVRFVATVLAIVVATGFLSATLVLRDSLSSALESNARNLLRGVDANVMAVGTVSRTPAPGGSTPESGTGSSGGAAVGGGQGPGVVLGSAATAQRDITPAELARIRAVPGVGQAAGGLQGRVGVLDRGGESIAENVYATLWTDADRLNGYHVAEGRSPERAGEIAVDQRTAERGALTPGSEVQLATRQGLRPATVVGVVGYGDQPSSGQGDVLLTPADAFAWLNDGRESYGWAFAAAAPGTTPEQLGASLRQVLGDGFTVQSGDQVRETAAMGTAGLTDILGYGLQGFAYLALFVSVFIIYNTFSIVVTQRTREFALLRALGASGTQVKRSVRVEALVLGVIASVIGFAIGAALFLVVVRNIGEFQDVAGSVSLRVTPLAVLQVVASGVLVTVVSAFVPGWRAARTRPVEALRIVAVDRSGTSLLRGRAGLVLLGLGVVLLLAGAFRANFWVMLAGPPVLFLGVIVGGPVLATAFAALARAVVRPFPGAALRVGVENVQRNPRRSATTALALVIGVFLVVLVTAGGGAIRDYVVGRLGELGGADVTVLAPDGVPPEYSRRLREAEGVDTVAEVHFDVGVAPVAGGAIPVSGVEPADVGALGLTAVEGDLGALGPEDAVVPDFGPQNPGPALGDPLTVTFGNGEQRTVRVGARVQLAFPPGVLVPAEVVRSADPSAKPTQLSVMAQSGKVQPASEAATRLAREFAGIEVLPGGGFVQIIKGFFNLIITAVNGLLSVAVVVALFGIVNTLVLSVTERTREIGLLRAVGMTRRQLAASIRLEAVVVSLLGAVVGLVFGLFAAWCLTRPILNQEGEAATPFSWPVAQLGLILVLAVVVGVLASLAPAWRASRMSIIDAVAME